MAAVSLTSLADEHDLSCPVCMNLFRNPYTPKELDCSHICCVKCIQEMVKGGRRQVECPECRHVTRVPADGVTAIKTANYRLRSLAEKHYERSQSDSLCAEHKIEVDFYCRKCQTTGCSKCMLYFHKEPDHEVTEIENIHGELKASMSLMCDQLLDPIQESERSIQYLVDLEEKMVQHCSEQKRNLAKHSESIIAKIRENTRQLQEDFDGIEQPKVQRVRDEATRLRKQVDEMKTMRSNVQKKMDTCNSRKYVEQQHLRLVQRIGAEQGKGHSCKTPEDLDPIIGKARLELHKLDATLGSLRQVQTCDLKECQEFGALYLGNSISTAATANGLILVTFDKNTINTYRRNQDGEYKKETKIRLSKTVSTGIPGSVAVSKGGKYLVVRDRVCVEVYSPTGQYEGIVDFKSDHDGNGEEFCKTLQPCSLNVVEEDGSLLVADYNSRIVRFTHDGVFQNAVTTSVIPYRIALVPATGKIAATNWRQNKLLIVDMASGEETLAIDIPQARAVCYHKETDTLLIGRCLRREDDEHINPRTGVIEQYCATTGALVKRVYGGESGVTCSPQDMVVTKDGRLMLAGHYTVKSFIISH